MTGFSDEITKSRYVRLTTFRRNGDAVPTPVWALEDGDTLTVSTQATSGKVKRLRNNPAVAIAPSDWRGNPKGADAHGTAEVIDDPALLARIDAKSKKRFGFEYTFMHAITSLRRTKPPMVALRITATSDAQASDGQAQEGA